MAQQTIGIGAVANDGTGDPLRTAFDKCNSNFTELYAALVGLLELKGSTDCSANPNYPAALKGDAYRVSVAGKIGGASGIDVESGDLYYALADNAGGDQATVGASWSVLQGNMTGGAGATTLDGLSDVSTAGAADGDVLAYNSAIPGWEPAAPGAGGGDPLAVASEWAPNFTAAGDVYIPAVVAMTIAQGNAAIGTGTLAFAKSTAAAPGTFTATTLPATLEAGAWLKVTASLVTGFVATHLKRTA